MTQKRLIYLLEDDEDISRLMSRTLTQQGMEVRAFRRIADFARGVAGHLPDLCMVDLSLPDGDGMSVIRDQIVPSDVPRIIVTGRGNLTDRVVGLEIGADDYVVKPFEPLELVARVRSVLRRANRAAEPLARQSERDARFGDWLADFAGCRLIHADGSVLQLSLSETTLLEALVKSGGRVLSRGQLLEATTGRSEEPYDRSMDARISRLRRKLRDDSKNPQIIRTVYGAGYVFGLKVARASGAAALGA